MWIRFRDNAGFSPHPDSTGGSRLRLFYRRILLAAKFRHPPLFLAVGPRLAFLAVAEDLAMRAEITAATGNDDAANRRAAAVAGQPFTSVSAMAALIVSRLTGSVDKVGDGGAAHGDGVTENVLQRTPQFRSFLWNQRRTETRGMDLGSPETFVGVDISDTAQDGLVEKQSLDARTARADAVGKGLGLDFKRLSAESQEFVVQRLTREISHAAEAARVGVAELAAIIEFEPNVGVLFVRFGSGLRREMAGHAEMNEQGRLVFAIGG